RTEKDPATEKEPRRIEHGDEVGESDPEQPPCLVEQPGRQLVSLVRSLLHDGDGHLVGLADEIEQLAADGWIALTSGARCGHRNAQVVARPGGEILPARVGLEAPPLAAGTIAPVGEGLDVTELAGSTGSAFVELAGHDDPGADVAADENDDEIVRAPSSAHRALPPGGDGELARDPEWRPR